ncbi:MAG: purine-nucleoside phosphorylase [Gordonia sp. (in: high G+C Gram-positive bacteria)]|uniref:purine-nucleoside phosphorylase n=1 Tax=Gordonia sp. (in: high G+C Gram-positive bacteria) TaxID=84139 RepID=UPI003BB58030
MATNSTPHIDPKGAPIAETILLPGDPLRAKFIAETYLDDPVCFNEVRNMLGFTGTYRGKPVSVMGTGMGIPSISLYSYELIHFFGVKNLIRVGSCGTVQPHIDTYDVVIAQGASHDSAYMEQYGLTGTYAPLSSWRLLSAAARVASERGVTHHVGNVFSSDIFYNADADHNTDWGKMGILAIEMESAGLFANAAHATHHLGYPVDALGIFTVSDNILKGTKTTPQERQTAFTTMIEIALEIA